MDAKKSFLFNVEWHEVLKDYPAEVRLEVYEAIIRYCASGTLSEMKPLAKMAFAFIKKDIDRHRPPRREAHWNWKGGITDVNHKIRQTGLYRYWRHMVLQRDKHTCQQCGAVGGRLDIHHIKPFSTNPELRFDMANGITLCRACHIALHKSDRPWGKRHS